MQSDVKFDLAQSARATPANNASGAPAMACDSAQTRDPAAVTITWRVIRRSVPDNPMEFDMKTFRTLAVAADEADGICGVERNGKVVRTFPAN